MISLFLLCWLVAHDQSHSFDCKLILGPDDPAKGAAFSEHPGATFHLWEIDVDANGPSVIDHDGILMAPAFPAGSKLLGTGPVELPR